MAENEQPQLSVMSVSSVFAHDLSTPVTTALLNADLLVEYSDQLMKGLQSTEQDNIPPHIKQAIDNAPQLIQQNLKNIQTILKGYKDYLNSLAVSDEDEISDTTSTSSSQPHNISAKNKLRILLVDDEEIHHDIGESILGENNAVKHDFCGEDALHRCKNELFDVILMDMQMPTLPGPQTVEQLRSFVAPSTLIFGLTSMPIEAQKQQLIECGFNGFLEKPLKLNEFNKLLISFSEEV